MVLGRRLLDLHLGRGQARAAGSRGGDAVEERPAVRGLVVGQTHYPVNIDVDMMTTTADSSGIRFSQTEIIRFCCDRVGAGHNFSVFVSSTGLVMTTGDGKYGSLGHGDWNGVSRPKLIGT